MVEQLLMLLHQVQIQLLLDIIGSTANTINYTTIVGHNAGI